MLLHLLVGGHRAQPPLTSVCTHASPKLMESHHGSCGDRNMLVPCQAGGHSSIPSRGGAAVGSPTIWQAACLEEKSSAHPSAAWT